MQLELFPVAPTPVMPQISLPDFDSIDHWILAFSGGKDSIACLLWLIENVDRFKLELWHHEVDGDGQSFVDWPCTRGYVKAVAAAFRLPIYFSGLCGGFKGEMMRDNEPHAASYFETPEGLMRSGGNGKRSSRLKFPAKVASLRTRWCSSALKIDVAKMAIANQPRFLGKKIVVVTGERWQESTARSKYAKVQYYCQPNSRRTVYQFRPVLDWSIEQVWEVIAKYKITPHPAYLMGFGRVSCRTCIFGSPSQWATIHRDFSKTFNRIAAIEIQLGHTIDTKRSIVDMADMGIAYPVNLEAIAAAESEEWFIPIFNDNWKLPLGAFGEQNGSI
jgi:3'-phosphoadenosine 5'-phosphosulfate sulfotransferase (PAPS reductase)/FAD synthetase